MPRVIYQPGTAFDRTGVASIPDASTTSRPVVAAFAAQGGTSGAAVTAEQNRTDVAYRSVKMV